MRIVTFRWVEHTGELQLEIDAATKEDVYASAVAAMGELLGDESDPGDELTREMTLAAPDGARLLAELIDELVYLAEVEAFVPVAAGRIEVGESQLRATIHGGVANPPHLVKSATYHDLAMDAVGGRWRARVVLDV